jgi:hypothetical protein
VGGWVDGGRMGAEIGNCRRGTGDRKGQQQQEQPGWQTSTVRRAALSSTAPSPHKPPAQNAPLPTAGAAWRTCSTLRGLSRRLASTLWIVASTCRKAEVTEAHASVPAGRQDSRCIGALLLSASSLHWGCRLHIASVCVLYQAAMPAASGHALWRIAQLFSTMGWPG